MIDKWKFWELGWKWNLWDILQGITEGTWDSSDPDVLRLVRSKTLHQSWTYFDNYFECMIRSLENEKVMVHYDILFSYWIIQTSQLGSYKSERNLQFPKHKRKPGNLEFPVWICGHNNPPRQRQPWNMKTGAVYLDVPGAPLELIKAW